MQVAKVAEVAEGLRLRIRIFAAGGAFVPTQEKKKDLGSVESRKY